MTQKIEDELDLPRLKDALDQLNQQDDEDTDDTQLDDEGPVVENEKDAESFKSAMDKTNRLEQQIADWDGFEKHDKEMDEVSSEAMNSYKDLMDLGFNVESKHSGQIFEPAVQMLKIALDARNSKSDKKLRLMRLQLERARLQRDMDRDNDSNPADGGEGEDSTITTDRNKLLSILAQMRDNDK